MTTIQRSNVEEPLRENTACVNDMRCITETLDDSLSFEVMDKIIACHDNIMCYSIVNHVFHSIDNRLYTVCFEFSIVCFEFAIDYSLY